MSRMWGRMSRVTCEGRGWHDMTMEYNMTIDVLNDHGIWEEIHVQRSFPLISRLYRELPLSRGDPTHLTHICPYRPH